MPPLVAIVANVQTPYRVHLHRRIVREMPEIRLASVYTHDQPDQPWKSAEFAEINPVPFGQGQPVIEQGKPKWARADWAKGGRIMRWLRDNDARAVVVGGYNDLTRLRLIFACRRAGIPCFVTADSNIHGDFATGFRRIVKSALVNAVVRRATGLMPCGTLGVRYFERYGGDPTRMFFFPYEPDYDLIRDLAADRTRDVRARYRLDPARRRAVVCARLIHVKRVDLAIDAFSVIAGERPDLDLVVIGDGPLRESLAARVPATLRHRVIFTGFIGDQAVISAIYRGSHLLLCPSDYEPWAVVLNEAAAAGLAIIASDVVGAAAELVRDNVNGHTFPVGNLAALTDHLRRATDAPTLDRLRAGSTTVLAAWRDRGDPVQGLKKALVYSNVISR
ncbi:MAG: glycosyltransferase [Phycisphaerales bacterium]